MNIMQDGKCSLSLLLLGVDGLFRRGGQEDVVAGKQVPLLQEEIPG